MRLIERCVCGRDVDDRRELTFEGLRTAECTEVARCGTLHQITEVSRADYEAQYLGPYHASAVRHPGCIPYKARYEHDRAIAQQRVRSYAEVLGIDFGRISTALDIGAANGAWVDALRVKRIDAMGIDPDPAMASATVITSRHGIRGVAPIVGGWDLVTFHDVLEHVCDPRTDLANAVGRTAHLGIVIVDVPDVFVPQGQHHFKPEHLWFFTEWSLIQLFADVGLELMQVHRPIPGKLVIAGYRP